MDRNAKVAWREEIESALEKSNAIFLAQYKGMTVEELSDFRRELKKLNADFKVVKNSITKKAVEARDEKPVASLLKGQLGIVFAYGDAAAAAKAVTKRADDNEKFVVVGGFMEALLSKENIKAISTLPSREVLLSKIIGSFVNPHRNMLGVLQGVPRALVNVLNQIKEQKAAAGGA